MIYSHKYKIYYIISLVNYLDIKDDEINNHLNN